MDYVCHLVYRLRKKSFGMVFTMVFWYMFGDFGTCTNLYGCKYCHEICYKDPISGTSVMSLLCYVCYVLMLVAS